MTPDDLRRLAAESTPGPWRPRDDGTIAANQERDTLASNGIDPGAVFKRPDARLIALAPDLALLVAEMGEALRRVREWDIIAGPGTPEGEFTADAPYWRGELDRALARLSELEARP